MKPKSNRFLTRAIAPALALISFTAIHAADIDTTGTTVALVPQNKYIGNGTLEVGGGGTVWLDVDSSASTTEFAMSGGLIDIVSGTELINGGWQEGTWTSNLAGMQVNGTFDIWDGKPVRIDALTGSGMIDKKHSGNSPTMLTVGVNNGDGIFSGTITNASGTIALTKEGTGSQTISGANSYGGLTDIKAGTLVAANSSALGASGWTDSNMTWIRDGATLALEGNVSINDHMHLFGAGVGGFGAIRSLSGDNALTMTYSNSGSGSGYSIDSNTTIGVDADSLTVTGFYETGGAFGITKVGNGTLKLTQACSYSGNTTVQKGTLSLGDGTSNANLSDAAGVILAAGTVLELNFSGEDVVGSLEINGSALPPGTYNSEDSVYGSYFTGSGSLTIIDTSSGTWTSVSDGSWENSDNWLNNILADGAGKTATFAAATGVTVTLDSGRTIGNLVFAGSNYTLTGTTLTLSAITPTISVATGISARVETIIAGTSGLAKTGAGTLTLTEANTYTGATTVSEGTLVSSNGFTNATPVSIASGATLRIDSARTDWPGANSFSGAGTLIFNPGAGNNYDLGGTAGLTMQMAAGAVIQVQSGTVRQPWGFYYTWDSNQASMTIDSGATFDLWDAYGIQIDALNGSGTLQKTQGGWFTINLNIGQAGGSGTFSGTISNTVASLNLVKNGSGTQALTGTTSYDGSTTVNGGILSLGNGTSPTGLPDASPVVIANGAKIDLNFSGTDTVGSVNLGGTTYTTPGSYNATTYPDFFTGTGSLVIPSADPFLSWIDATWPSLSDKNATGDPDHDGIANLVEYILKDGDPSASSTGTLPTLDATGTNFVFSYLRRAAATGTTQSFEYSSTLDAGSWTSVAIPGTGVTVTDEGNGIEKVEITVAKGTNAKLFGRLQVTQP